ncbi:arginase family protein [Microbacterium aoyamense]|uniref:Arginase family protein n=1 Tax=Microbacterium aoyamense TaxID=344166 RepID=A0ABN2PQG7_9MICO|nr:arginase family protein [Microbacterium aoyamense]
MTRYLVVPQWQGSPSSRAMQLIDGAEAIAGDLPRSATLVLDVPTGAGEALGTGVRRLSALLGTRDRMVDALAPFEEPVLTVGGDCGVALGAIGHAVKRHPSLAVVWLDAHPDFNDAGSSPSGAFAGMTLRAVVGQGEGGLMLEPGVVPPRRVVVGGARSFDEPEAEAIERLGVAVLSVDALRDPESLATAVRETGAEALYVHVDVDVLDPAELTGNAHPEPFGLTVAELTGAIAAARAALPLVGSSITGYSPASAATASDDLGAILRIVGALA